jgi:hypothetical protein
MESIALVTGASSGIGQQAAFALAKSGHAVIVGYGRNKEAADATVAEIQASFGVAAYAEQIQMDHPDRVEETAQRILSAHGPVQVLVNNAGVNRRKMFLSEDLDSWNRVLNIDLTSPFVLAKTVTSGMVDAGVSGRIVNVTSVHDRMPISGGSAYCVAKAGLGMLTQSMALELGKFGITVNAVAPGETATPMNSPDPNYTASTVVRPILPVARPGDPREVGELIAYLCSPPAAYVTGQTFVIDGGLALIAADANVRSVLGSIEEDPRSRSTI